MNLTNREKQLIAAGAVLFGLIISFHVFVKPAISRVKTLKRVVPEKRQLLSELRAKSNQFKAIAGELEKVRLEIGRLPEGRNILSFVERLQTDCGLLQNVVYMRPSTLTVKNLYERITVEIKLQDITLEQLIQFLLKIESSKLTIGIRTLEIKRAISDSNTLETTIQLVTLSIIQSN